METVNKSADPMDKITGAEVVAGGVMTVSEFAERFGLHPVSVRRMVSKGALPSVLIGRCRRIPVAALAAYFDQQLGRAA